MIAVRYWFEMEDGAWAVSKDESVTKAKLSAQEVFLKWNSSQNEENMTFGTKFFNLTKRNWEKSLFIAPINLADPQEAISHIVSAAAI